MTPRERSVLLRSLSPALVAALAACAGAPPPAAPSASTVPSSASSAPVIASSAPSAPASPVVHDADDEAGGECAAKAFAGICTAKADGTFTYEGTVDGNPVVLPGNPFYGKVFAARLPPGKSAACDLKLSTAGTCSPCTVTFGSCGEAALDVFRHRL